MLIFLPKWRQKGLKGFLQNIFGAGLQAMREKAIQIKAFYRSYMKTDTEFNIKDKISYISS